MRHVVLRLAAAAQPSNHQPPASSWRVTTAVRAFGLAVVAGQALDRHQARDVGVLLIGLCVVAAASCTCELGASRRRLPWISLSESVLVALLVGLAGGAADLAFLYLAIPAVVAGVNAGRLGLINTWLTTLLAFCAAQAVGHGARSVPTRMSTVLLWLAVGLGAGLLAAHQARSIRRVEAEHAPYAAAHRLVAQLHTLVRQRPDLLDVTTQSTSIREAIHESLGADCSALMVSRHDGIEPVASSGQLATEALDLGRLCAFYGQRLRRREQVALPLRVGQHAVGALVLTRATGFSESELDDVQAQLDEHSIRLETALLVDDVRLVATSEERKRLARDIHDGVAQRVVCLGYLADDIAATSGDPAARKAAEDMREEIGRLISELRFSVFDLRHDVQQAGGLSAALSDYVQELSRHSQLRVHLTLDETDPQLSQRTESELLRIAQEALGNVHRHARAINVWVRLRVVGTEVTLVVEDDGVGGAAALPGHYGMHTMSERAQRIDADVEVGTRHDGGTTVTVQSRSRTREETGAHHDQRLARR